MNRLLLAFVVIGLVGCGEETGIPQPDPIPKVSLLRSNAVFATPADPPAPVKLVALPGCVAGEGTVTVELGATRVTATSRAGGSFALTILARAGDKLAIRYNRSDPAAFQVPSLGVGGAIPPGPIPGVPPITPASAGRVLVRGQADPSRRLLGVCPASGDVVSFSSGADGRFQVELVAASGQELTIYEDDEPLLGSGWTLTVP